MDIFKVRRDVEAMTHQELVEYSKILNEYLTNFETSSVKKMLVSLDNIAQKITDDLDKIVNGNEESLDILQEDSKIFDKIQKLVEKIDSWKKVSEMAESLRPEIEEVKQVNKKPQLKIDTSANVMEQLLKSR